MRLAVTHFNFDTGNFPYDFTSVLLLSYGVKMISQIFSYIKLNESVLYKLSVRPIFSRALHELVNAAASEID